MIATAAPRNPTARNPWEARTIVIRDETVEAPGVTTYEFAFEDDAQFNFRAGQFCMLYLPGVGEVPIGVSGFSQDRARWRCTVRVAGNVTRTMAELRRGDTLGLRGPFGSFWPLYDCRGRDVVFAAGGLGLPPLRPAIHEMLAQRDRYGKMTLIYGARTPESLIYSREYDEWSRRGLDVQTTVDQAPLGWKGNVGVVPRLLDRLSIASPHRTTVLTCGPEVMMRFVVRSALARGIPTAHAWVSLERNMQCAIGLCGHCQFGPEFICKDGPVFRYDRVERWLGVEAL